MNHTSFIPCLTQKAIRDFLEASIATNMQVGGDQSLEKLICSVEEGDPAQPLLLFL